MKTFAPLLSALLLCQHAAMACVGCRTPEVGNEEPQTILAGVAFSWSVITMLVIVLGAIGGLTIYIAKTCQRLDREKNPR